MKPLIIFILFFSCHSSADIFVIGNLENGLTSMTKKEVRDIFMGRTRSFPNGSFALPIDQQGLRSHFYYALTDRPIEQINAYWARIMFSGQASPPIRLPDSQSIINVVIENKGAISYIDQNKVDENSVKILLILK